MSSEWSPAATAGRAARPPSSSKQSRVDKQKGQAKGGKSRRSLRAWNHASYPTMSR
ncbi:hypothetical protein ACCAA_270030 [Candidatus Accumulibacter aalborgensis]|uniref:Uncharacterized protein n=1 Tax=Candidatus Accumulibacter aalborgensis TaxID=1860102 RepID=A0A1A8XKS7_9PROT|nr:hypothetical protein ACCAA_270030 [Candidatus Accumulibacter aalborgensis]